MITLTETEKGEFFKLVSVAPTARGCLEWLGGTRNRFGYGRFTAGQKEQCAHRVAWTLAFGQIPDGLFVLHSCDNPRCCNPEHFFLGTRAQNNADRDRKGRQICRRGELVNTAKLTPDKVRDIRVRARTGELHLGILATEFGVTRQAISSILHGKSWKHVIA